MYLPTSLIPTCKVIGYIRPGPLHRVHHQKVVVAYRQCDFQFTLASNGGQHFYLSIYIIYGIYCHFLFEIMQYNNLLLLTSIFAHKN